MVTPTPTKIKNGVIGLNYILQDDAHYDNYGSNVRNESFCAINCFEGYSLRKQFEICWNRASEQHTNQLRHYIISFSKNEVDPENQAEMNLAMETAVDYFQEAFPNRQIIVALQRDGRGGNVHIHAMVNDCDLSPSANGLTPEQRSRGYFRKTCTAYMKEHFFDKYGINYDYGRNRGKYGLYERTFAETLDEYKRAFDGLKAEQAKDKPDKDAIADYEATIKDNKYVWKAHLTQNIRAARDSSVSWDDFVNRLGDFGVILEDSGKHIKYKLDPEEYARYTDAPYPDHPICRGKTLDPSFARDELKEYFDSLTPEQIQNIIDRNAELFPNKEEEEAETSVQTDEGFVSVTEEPEEEAVAEDTGLVSSYGDETPVQHHSKKEPEEAWMEDAPVPKDSKLEALLSHYDPGIFMDDADVADEDEFIEDELLIEAGYDDVLPEEPEENPEEKDKVLEWMQKTYEKYTNINGFMNESDDKGNGEAKKDDTYLGFF